MERRRRKAAWFAGLRQGTLQLSRNPKLEFFKFGGYFNVDTGTGQVHGAAFSDQRKPPQFLRQALAPFEDLGVYGAVALRSRNLGGTDSTKPDCRESG